MKVDLHHRIKHYLLILGHIDLVSQSAPMLVEKRPPMSVKIIFALPISS